MTGTTPPTLAFLGGTGSQGRGLALRYLSAGYPVVLGSRDADRAAEAAAGLAERVPDADVRGATNEEAAGAGDVVFVTLPHAGLAATLEPCAEPTTGKVVISCVNALAFDRSGPYPVAVPDGSAAEEVARYLPGARVAGSYHNVSAARLMDVGTDVTCDALVCADDDDARRFVAGLAGEIAGMRGVEVGGLRLSGAVESMTAVLLSVNQRYSTHAGVQVTGVEGQTAAPASTWPPEPTVRSA